MLQPDETRETLLGLPAALPFKLCAIIFAQFDSPLAKNIMLADAMMEFTKEESGSLWNATAQMIAGDAAKIFRARETPPKFSLRKRDDQIFRRKRDGWDPAPTRWGHAGKVGGGGLRPGRPGVAD
jgi:hypothetical protein